MADATTDVQPLNGLEIVDDFCGIIAERLKQDCNLREIDGYSSGYKATVKIHIECYGLDAAIVDQEFTVDETTKDAVGQEPDELIDLEIEIPQEQDLSLVRERSGQAEPNIEFSSQGPVETPKPRKYTRRLKALHSAQGGAAGEITE